MSNDEKPPMPRFAIHPGLGIARLGDSPEEFFIGPEAPNWRPVPNGGYKDSAYRVKRQAARFRIYQYDQNGVAIRELTAADCTITWTVHLANKKASWYKFVGRYKWEDPANHTLRNPTVQGAMPPDQRTDLIIDPGPRSISGLMQDPVRFDSGKFMGEFVYLGELRTDKLGRLLVLGGLGKSESVRPNNPISTYANNDGWHDDSADGIVRATIALPDGTTVEADPAWVLVAPPKFAPQIDNMVTLDDVMREVAEAQSWTQPPPEGVNFYRDIYPILSSAANYAWVSAIAYRGHGAGAQGDFTDPEYLKPLLDSSDQSRPIRQALFSRIRVPLSVADPQTAAAQATLRYMPLLSGDDGDATNGQPRTWLSVLPGQYARLKSWAEGQFVAGSKADEVPLEMLPVSEQPAALDAGALQPCVGGPFYPGIEMTFISGHADTWRAPYRINASWKPGDVTRWMAVPWQADFFECMFHWWPAQRPDDVLPEGEYADVIANWDSQAQPDTNVPTKSPVAAAAAERVSWTRGLPEASPAGDNAMVKYWNELGFVIREKAPSGELVYVERQRKPGAGMDVRELFYKLMNVDRYPEILPKAHEYATQCLAEAVLYQNDPDTPEMWRPFDYTRDAFQARIMDTYRGLLIEVQTYDPASDATFKSADDVRERIRQFAPFNMSDGSWLRNITRIGPIDEARALLFSVLMDEIGDGEVSHNHSNIYRDLCHSIGFYPPDCTSYEFAYSDAFLDSGFEVPTFELAISQFSETWYPELLGMTLQLELGIIEAKNTIALMEYYGFDPKYWVMHVGIDNPVNGHAQRAMRAIELYLDGVRANGGGEAAVQAQWQRIWNGYVAFGTTGTFGDDFANALAHKPSLDQQVQTMISAKAKYGSMNHDTHSLGNVPINELFLDPPTFMKKLVDAGFFIPGDPDNSPFFRLTSFETGRMYRVFTDDELKLWADWCRSLTAPAPTPPKPDAYADMVVVVQTLRNRQFGALGHASSELRSPQTGAAHSVAWWFEQPTRDFLEALAWPDNKIIQPGNPDASYFVTQLIAPAGPMGQAFADVVPGLGGRTGSAVAIAWIKDGCPLPPKAKAGGLRTLWLAATEATVHEHHTRRRRGMGAIH